MTDFSSSMLLVDRSQLTRKGGREEVRRARGGREGGTYRRNGRRRKN